MINTFMLARDRSLVEFVKAVSAISRGKAYFTTTMTLGRPGLLQRRSAFDWLYALAVVLGAAYAYHRYGASMDGYEKGILAGATPALIGLGWFWGSTRVLALAVGAAALMAIGLYGRVTDGFGADLAAGEKVFLLKYFLGSQSAFLWMGVLFVMSSVSYWIGFFVKTDDNTAQRLGSRIAWAGVFFGVVCGVVVLDEPLSGTFALAAAIVGAGIELVNFRR